jgi:predicted acyl esterase
VNSATGHRDVIVDLGHLGYRLPAGHRLRVHISSSDFPEFVPQPGTGEDPWAATDTRPNTQSLVVGGAHGFTLDLSILPGGER